MDIERTSERGSVWSVIGGFLRDVWFYMVVFVVAVGIPGLAVYFVADKYDDKPLFYISTALSAIFVGGALVFSYLRARRSREDMGSPNSPRPEHWDGVCLSIVTLATAVLAALFTLVGFADEVFADDDLRVPVIVIGMLAIGAYFTCIGFAYASIFAEQVQRKRANAQETAGMFIAEVIAVVAVAFLVIWAKL